MNWWAEGGRPQRGPAFSNLAKARREPKSLNLFSDGPRWAGNPSVLVLTLQTWNDINMTGCLVLRPLNRTTCLPAS